MVEPLRRRATSDAAFRRGRLTLIELEPPAAVNLRGSGGDAAFLRAAGAALGCKLPTTPNSVETAAERSIIWLGPDEWLILGSPGIEAAVTDELEAALEGQHVSVVNVSGNRALFRLSGDGALETLQKGCSLDLHPGVFVPGQAAQTQLARAQVLLIQRDGTPTYDILPRRSFAHYLRAWLEDAMSGR